ncbi:MAG: hypothetical protein R3F11_03565 [Verrucomicrobiales bacterium]
MEPPAPSPNPPCRPAMLGILALFLPPPEKAGVGRVSIAAILDPRAAACRVGTPAVLTRCTPSPPVHGSKAVLAVADVDVLRDHMFG